MAAFGVLVESEAALGGRSAEAEVGEGDDHDVESWICSTVAGGEEWKDLSTFQERSRPAMDV